MPHALFNVFPSTLVLIQIIITLNLLIIFSLLFIYRKASRAESRNSKSQSRASSKVSKSNVESSPDIKITEEEEEAYAEWEAMDARDRHRIILRERSPPESEDEEPVHYK